MIEGCIEDYAALTESIDNSESVNQVMQRSYEDGVCWVSTTKVDLSNLT